MRWLTVCYSHLWHIWNKGILIKHIALAVLIVSQCQEQLGKFSWWAVISETTVIYHTGLSVPPFASNSFSDAVVEGMCHSSIFSLLCVRLSKVRMSRGSDFGSQWVLTMWMCCFTVIFNTATHVVVDRRNFAVNESIFRHVVRYNLSHAHSPQSCLCCL